MSSLIQTVVGIAVTIAFALMLVLAVTEQPAWQPNPATGIPTEVQPQ